MIKSFKDSNTENIFNEKLVLSFPHDIQRTMLRKLTILNAAISLEDLRVPPGNRLEKLTRNLKGLWSIRVNDQWRVCFRWQQGNAYEVEIKDYH